jgi:apolipoprotein N-acyltransferase
LAAGIAVLIAALPAKRGVAMAIRLAMLAILGLFFCAYLAETKPPVKADKTVRVAGVQLEFPGTAEVIISLNHLLLSEPSAQIFVLSEYTLDGPVPEEVRAWCREHGRYLVVGGKDPAPGSNFYDTAFVVGPNGEIVFRQVKAVPIQFFKDGLPASEQKLWDSPWGKIGFCVCYDLSYTRVTDRLVRLGAEALIVPTMDIVDWGRREHELHGRIGPVRSAEYGVPIFRVASSGISQFTDRQGRVHASAGFPGSGATLAADLPMAGPGTVPLDRWLAPCCSGVTVLTMLWFLRQYLSSRRRKIESGSAVTGH